MSWISKFTGLFKRLFSSTPEEDVREVPPPSSIAPQPPQSRSTPSTKTKVVTPSLGSPQRLAHSIKLCTGSIRDRWMRLNFDKDNVARAIIIKIEKDASEAEEEEFLWASTSVLDNPPEAESEVELEFRTNDKRKTKVVELQEKPDVTILKLKQPENPARERRDIRIAFDVSVNITGEIFPEKKFTATIDNFSAGGVKFLVPGNFLLAEHDLVFLTIEPLKIRDAVATVTRLDRDVLADEQQRIWATCQFSEGHSSRVVLIRQLAKPQLMQSGKA